MSLTRSKPSQTDTEQRADLTVAELFADYTATIRELRRRRVIRTQNAPAGDYAEYLVQRAFGGTIAPNSQKSWDVLAANGDRLQVKCRVVSDPIKPSERQLGILRSFEFDAVMVVHLSATDYSVRLVGWSAKGFL